MRALATRLVQDLGRRRSGRAAEPGGDGYQPVLSMTARRRHQPALLGEVGGGTRPRANEQLRVVCGLGRKGLHRRPDESLGDPVSEERCAHHDDDAGLRGNVTVRSRVPDAERRRGDQSHQADHGRAATAARPA